MSQSVDNRIVNMIFNNREFEEGVAETTESLDKLKKGLDFSNSSIDLSGVVSGLEALQSRFSVIGEQVHQFVTNIVNQTKRLVDQAMIEPIRDGFNEYELKMGSVQTILNSAFNRAGEAVTLEEVNYQLNELNKYADRTIYSFKDMTANIGKFTNAGVALEDAVAAIQGVSNVAAVSGANAADASRAMYNFAQALSSGYVKLIDWKSIENANMATVEFKNQLLESAVAAGTLEKTADGMYRVLSGGGYKENGVEQYISATNHFNDSLSKAWMTTEVLTSTLSKYSDETTEIGKKAFAAATEVKTLSQAWDTLKEAAGSTWAETWETIFGDLNQSKVLWTRLEQDLEAIFVKGGEKRNELLKEWTDLGGRDYLFSTDENNLGALFNLLEAIKQIISVVKQAFKEVFGEANVFRLLKLTYSFQQFTASLVLTGDRFKQVKTALKGVFSVFALFKDILSAAIKPFKEFFEGFSYNYSNWAFFQLIEDTGNSLISLRDKVLKSGILDKISSVFGKFFFNLGFFVSDVVSTIHHAITLFTGSNGFLKFGSVYVNGEWLKPLTTLQKVVSALYIVIRNVSSSIVYFLASIFGFGDEAASAASGAVFDFFDKIASSILHLRETLNKSKIVEKLKDFWASIRNFGDGGVAAKISDFWAKFTGWLGEVASKIHPLQTLKSIFSSLIELFKHMFAFLGPIIGNLGSAGVNLLKTIINLGIELFKTLGQSMKDGTLGSLISGGLKISLGAGLFKTFKSFNEALGNVGGAFESLGGILGKFTGQAKPNDLQKTAVAVGILTASLLVLASIDPVKMTAGIIGIRTLMEVLTKSVASMAAINVGKSLSSVTSSLIKMGAAILILSASLKIIAGIDPTRLAGSMLVLTGLLAELTTVVKVLGTGNNLKSLKSVGTGLISLSAAILVLALAVKAFGSMDAATLEQGFSTVSLFLAELAIFAKIAGNTKRMASVGVGMALISTAILGFVASVKILGGMDEGAWIKGMTAFTILLGEISLVALAFDHLNPGKVIVASASMILLANAMLEVSIVLRILGSMGLESLGISLIAFSTTLLLMVGALTVLSGINPGKLLASAGAMVVMGAALLEMSVALKILSTMSLGELAVALAAIVSTIVILGVTATVLGPVAPTMLAIAGAFAIFGIGAMALGAGLTLISIGLTALSVSLIASMEVLLEAIKIGIRALPELLAALAQSLEEGFSSLASLLITVIMAALKAVSETVPEIVKVVLDLINQVLKSIADNIEGIVISLLEILVGIIEGMAKGLPEVVTAIIHLFKAIFAALKDALGEFSVEMLLEAIGVVALLTTLMTELAALSALALVATLSLPTIGSNLGKFMTNVKPFLDGISKVGTETLEGAEALGKAVLALTAASIIEGLTRWITGKSSFESFGKELAAFGPYLKQYNDSIKGIDATSVATSALAVQYMADMANNLPNSGGLVSWFQGDNTLSDFGKMLAEFGPYFKKYADSVAGINATAVSASATAAKSLADMANSLPNSGGLISWITGDNTLADFGAMLASFGPYLKSYSDSVVGLNVQAIATSVVGATYLATLATAIDAISFKSDTGSVSNFGAQIAKLAGNLYSYATYMAAINWVAFATSVEEVNKLVDLSDRISLINVNNLTTFGRDIKTLANNGINMFITAFTNAFTKAYNKGAEFAKKAVNGINSTSGQFTNAGANLMQGFINGINSRAQSVYNTANVIANNAANTIRRALQIHSPSKVMEQIGMYTDLGFANGLMKYVDTIEESADYVGMTTLDTMANAIQDAVNNIEDNPDFNPVITPVLDLSYVNDGLGRLGDSFDSSRLQVSGYYKTSMDLAGMVMETNRNNQNGGSILRMMTEMIDEIATLSSAVENMQIVMDSGTVVGAIAPKMDVALGRRVTYKGRGN